MLRNVACAGIVLCLSLGIAMSEEFKGKVTKIGDGKVTIMVKNKDTKKAEAKDLTLAKEVKVFKMEGKDKVSVADGLKAEVLSNIDAKKGVTASVLTNADNQVTEIILAGKKKKKNE